MKNDAEVLKEELDIFMNWIVEEEIVYMAENSSNGYKKLVATLNGTFKVYFKDEIVLRTSQPYIALEKYLNL